MVESGCVALRIGWLGASGVKQAREMDTDCDKNRGFRNRSVRIKVLGTRSWSNILTHCGGLN